MQFLRNANVKLGKYFNSNEFDCHCGQCAYTTVNAALIEKLDVLREAIGPIRINSGYRCQFRQDQLRGKGLETSPGRSSHQDGLAADISHRDSKGSYLLAEAQKSGFKRIGVAYGWIHVDIKPGELVWYYRGAEMHQ